MTLDFFFIAIAIALIGIVVLFYRGKKVSRNPVPYFIVLTLAILGSYLTFQHYAKSQGGYFKNIEYHIIQQDGFKYPKGQRLLLTSDNSPEKAILETGVGELFLDGEGRLQSEGFQLPLYVEKVAKTNIFEVVNVDEELSMSDGEELTIKEGDRLLLKMKYEEVRKGKKIDKYRFVFSVRDTTGSDTWERTVFRQGYSLAEMVQARIDATTRSLFENCYLVRKNYQLDVLSPDKASGKVYLVGVGRLSGRGISFFKNGIELSTNSGNDIKNEPMDGRLFFYGLGETRSPLYKVSATSGSISVLYGLPKMYHFPQAEDGRQNGLSTLFLTTDKQEIINARERFDSFYQFCDQLNENSIYKSSAAVTFLVDSSGVSINSRYYDMNADVDSVAETEIVIGEPFEIRSLSCRMPDDGTAQVSYLFRIRDMRKNVVFQKTSTLYLLMLLMLLGIYLLLYVLSKETPNRINKLYIVETSVYLTLIAFLTIRLVLLWRLHTFPPLDHVSRFELNTLTDEKNFWWTLGAIVVILGARIVILFLQWLIRQKSGTNLNELIDNLFSKMEENRCLRIIIVWVLPVALYILCSLAGRVYPPLSVIAKEAVAPLLAFAINSIYYVHRIKIPIEQQDRIENKRRGVFCWGAITINTGEFLSVLVLSRSFLGFSEHGMLLPMAGVFLVWLCIAIFHTPTLTKWVQRVSLAIVLAMSFVVFDHVPLARTSFGNRVVSSLPKSFSRVKDRVFAVSETPSEMVQNQRVLFEDKTMQDILNASSNKWFIDNHLAQRYYLKHKKSGFILDKEYDQRAVSYTTQTRDVVLLRYVIYEHGNGVVKKLLLILLLLTVNVSLVYRRKGKTLPFLQQLPLQSSLFLLVYSAYLYLVNLNAVVFVGLDFPFLSLTSKVAPMGLLLPLLAILLPVNITQPEDSFVGDLVDSNFNWERVSTGVLVAVIIPVLVVFPSCRMERQIKANNGTSTASFSVSMEPLAVFVNEYVNPQLRVFQENHDANTRIRKEKFENMSIGDQGLKDRFKEFVMGNEDGNALLDNQLKLFAKQTRWANDTTFIRSAFKKSFNTSMIDPNRNIIHLRKLSGRFMFVTNKVYYDMKPMFDNSMINDWHGDLLAAASANHLTFAGENHKEAVTLKKGFYVYGDRHDTNDNVHLLKEEFLGSNRDGNIRFTIVQIPKAYCYMPGSSENDVFVLMPVDSPDDKSFIVYPDGDATNPVKKKNAALWIKPNDIVKVNGARQSFSFNSERGDYFSKRIHYNGKYQVIYPMGSRFIFAYNFDQMLADNYHPVKSSEDDVRISLDYKLLNDVYDYCDSAMLGNRTFGNGITVTGIDGNGRIRLLADYNPKKRTTADPNHASELRRIMEEIYLNGNTPEERSLLQNRNLTRMSIGPGSTIKVPFYVAVAAEANIDWTKVNVVFPNSCVDTKSERDVVQNYGSYQTHGIHRDYDGWDELSGEYRPGGSMNSSSFITSSNNFFFGSIIGLSSFSSTQLYKGLGGVLEASSSREAVFPLFSLDNHYYKFKKEFVNALSDDRELENSLNENFRYLRWQSRDYNNQTYDVTPVDFLFKGDTTQTHRTRTKTTNSLYVYSERPNLHREIKTVQPDEVILSFLHLTSGGAKHLSVTPLNMAEAYLRIALLNSAENILTYDDSEGKIPFKPFVTVHDDFAEQMKSTTFQGMWNVIGSGTLANSVDQKVRNDYMSRRSPIYVYGKTGTVNNPGIQSHDNYHYAFILSNKRLDQTSNREGLKVYVVYFGFYDTGLGGHSGTAKTRMAILNKIINSESFLSYWND